VGSSEIIAIDGRKLLFKVEAFDEKEKIGEGQHERFIISSAKFMEKTYAKLS
jgi:predicted thioesterase